jgi:hypothetical protein
MTVWGAAIGVALLLSSGSAELARVESRVPASNAQRQPFTSQAPRTSGRDQSFERTNDYPIGMLPGTLADLVDTLAGGSVRLVNARVVGVFDPQVFLIETQTRLRPIVARNRVLVFVESGALRVDAARIVASTVTVSGVARTLLGMQTAREVPWPSALTRETIERLDIRAAVLARSVRTPEGVDLLSGSRSRDTPSPSPPAGR